MKKLILIFILLVFGSGISFSQTDDNGAPYFPLRVGNAFYYNSQNNNGGRSYTSFVISRITGSRIINGKRYFYCVNFCGTPLNYYLRYDRASGNIVKYDSLNTTCNYEYALFRLSANVGDSVQTTCGDNNIKCDWISDTTIFGISTRQKSFYYGRTNWGIHFEYDYHFSRNLGCTQNMYSEISSYYFRSTIYSLQGCRINGIVRGDTINHIIPVYSDSGKYLPLAIGNKWVYMYHSEPPTNEHKGAVVITKDTIVNNRRYFYVSGIFGDNPVWARFDGYSGRLMGPSSSVCNNDYETMLYDLAANTGDSARAIPCCWSDLDKCGGITDTTLLGHSSRLKTIGWSGVIGNGVGFNFHFFAKDLGMYFSYSGYSGNAYTYFSMRLLGCYINGILYGDTNSVNQPNYADSSRYFPLRIGNEFYYKYSRYGMGLPIQIDSGIYVTRITDTSRINGKLYYKLNTFLTNDSINYFRYDLDSGMLVAYYPYAGCNYEESFYKLISVPYDSVKTSCLYNNPQKCEVLKDTMVFNLQKKLKTFIYHVESQYAGNYIESFLVKDFGLVHYKNISVEYHWGHSALAKYDLVGAKINGVIYGDTNTVDIKSIYNNVPDKYALYQNYPNPFNPSTIIRFQIKDLRFVTLKVYDILGKEIATLVNEKQSPGMYEATWDASQFPSGVYFYKLQAGDFSETKKALLIK